MTHKTLIKISLLLVLMLTGPLSAAYAQKGAAMKGMVRDEFGKPLVGVAIRSANGNNRSVTQKDGSYSIDVNDGSDRVVFSYLGYADQSVPYRKGADVDVKMLADGHYGDQTIHMGYTDQKLKDVSGAVSVVTGDELRKSPVASPSQALTGRLTGLYLDEYQSEPTREKLYAIGRGLHTQNYNTTPLVVIDGIPCSYNANESYQYINANEIETVTSKTPRRQPCTAFRAPTAYWSSRPSAGSPAAPRSRPASTSRSSNGSPIRAFTARGNTPRCAGKPPSTTA